MHWNSLSVAISYWGVLPWMQCSWQRQCWKMVLSRQRVPLSFSLFNTILVVMWRYFVSRCVPNDQVANHLSFLCLWCRHLTSLRLELADCCCCCILMVLESKAKVENENDIHPKPKSRQMQLERVYWYCREWDNDEEEWWNTPKRECLRRRICTWQQPHHYPHNLICFVYCMTLSPPLGGNRCPHFRPFGAQPKCQRPNSQNRFSPSPWQPNNVHNSR